jgi:hypothetical protein
MKKPGIVAILGSGETAYAGGQMFDLLAQHLLKPLEISILETPAGFELNSNYVAGRVAEYMHTRLQNYQPEIHVIPARKRGTSFSPDNPALLDPMLRSNLIYMGAGSPSYTVRQLSGSQAWDILRARHRLGAAIALSSAASIAVGKVSLPVYEIYKVGEDPHWNPGLDLFGEFGLPLAIVPHWNNNDGGTDLDTSRCFIGKGRFQELVSQLPAKITIVGIDERTGLLIDLIEEKCQVVGQDSVHIILPTGEELAYASGKHFSLEVLGHSSIPANLADRIHPDVWERVLEAERNAGRKMNTVPLAPTNVMQLVEERQRARGQNDWKEADRLRDRIQALGWQIQDTPVGPQVVPDNPN